MRVRSGQHWLPAGQRLAPVTTPTACYCGRCSKPLYRPTDGVPVGPEKWCDTCWRSAVKLGEVQP